MEEICAAATWASPCTFARFYKQYFGSSFEIIRVSVIPHYCVGTSHPPVLKHRLWQSEGMKQNASYVCNCGSVNSG